jgi:hypothetical protein
VPQLAQLLVRKNAEGGPKLNIKGMMVGNPLTVCACFCVCVRVCMRRGMT